LREAVARKPLLTTTTGEPFMPVRLYFEVPPGVDVSRTLDGLRCCERDLETGGWGWLYEEEAAGLVFHASQIEPPKVMQPIVIARMRLEVGGWLTVTVRSVERAVVAASFFAPRLGKAVVLRRARIAHRLFEGGEAPLGLPALDALLDKDVTVIDPEVEARIVEEVLASAPADPEAKLAALDRYYRQRRKDVPPVEDFPLCPEEEDEAFTQLALTFRFRAIRAYERWRGNDVTLDEVIRKMVTGEPGLSVSVGAPKRRSKKRRK